MDDEAITILGDYLDRYYNDRSLSEEEIFSKAFADTAERIMTVHKSPVVPIVIGVVVVAVAGAAVVIVKKRNEQREREQKRTQDILNSPLPKFGDEAEQLAQKYEKDASGGTAGSGGAAEGDGAGDTGGGDAGDASGGAAAGQDAPASAQKKSGTSDGPGDVGGTS